MQKNNFQHVTFIKKKNIYKTSFPNRKRKQQFIYLSDFKTSITFKKIV